MPSRSSSVALCLNSSRKSALVLPEDMDSATTQRIKTVLMQRSIHPGSTPPPVSISTFRHLLTGYPYLPFPSLLYSHNHVTLIPDVNDLKRRLEGMADVDRKVLSKRDRDFRGRDCHTICVALDPEVFYPEPNQDDCKSIPSLLDPHSNQTFSIGSCTLHLPSRVCRVITPE